MSHIRNFIQVQSKMLSTSARTTCILIVLICCSVWLQEKNDILLLTWNVFANDVKPTLSIITFDFISNYRILFYREE